MNKLQNTKQMHESVGIEFVHGDQYGVAMDVLKKFVAKSDTRPILKYAMHFANGDVIATDSNRVIKLDNIHGFDQQYIIDPKNLMVAKSDKFPPIANVLEMAQKDSFEVLVLDKSHIHLWLNVFKSIVQTMKAMKVQSRNKVVDLYFNQDGVSVSVESLNLNFTLPFGVYQKPESLETIRFNCEYMKDALEAHYKLNSLEVTIRFAGSLKPFSMNDGQLVTTLILPCRVY